MPRRGSALRSVAERERGGIIHQDRNRWRCLAPHSHTIDSRTCTCVHSTTHPPRIQILKGPKKTDEFPKRISYYEDYDDEDDDDDEEPADLNVQMIPLEDDFVPETGIDCTLTQEAEEAGDVYAPYMPVSVFYIILRFLVARRYLLTLWRPCEKIVASPYVSRKLRRPS